MHHRKTIFLALLLCPLGVIAFILIGMSAIFGFTKLQEVQSSKYFKPSQVTARDKSIELATNIKVNNSYNPIGELGTFFRYFCSSGPWKIDDKAQRIQGETSKPPRVTCKSRYYKVFSIPQDHELQTDIQKRLAYETDINKEYEARFFKASRDLPQNYSFFIANLIETETVNQARTLVIYDNKKEAAPNEIVYPGTTKDQKVKDIITKYNYPNNRFVAIGIESVTKQPISCKDALFSCRKYYGPDLFDAALTPQHHRYYGNKRTRRL